MRTWKDTLSATIKGSSQINLSNLLASSDRGSEICIRPERKLPPRVIKECRSFMSVRRLLQTTRAARFHKGDGVPRAASFSGWAKEKDAPGAREMPH